MGFAVDIIVNYQEVKANVLRGVLEFKSTGSSFLFTPCCPATCTDGSCKIFHEFWFDVWQQDLRGTFPITGKLYITRSLQKQILRNYQV